MDVVYDTDHEFEDMEFRRLQLEIRESEMGSLITQICGTVNKEPSFIQRDLKQIVAEKAKVDIEKVVLFGHEFGGLSSITSSIGNNKVRAIAALDPWMTPCSASI